jgi:CHAT domain-containing protein
LLQSGEFDLVHYSGHAVFVPEYPDRSGWIFKEDVFTPSRLGNVDAPPRLIVANACLSARIAGDAQFVASLADEFFRRGVADYIGTAWEVPELPATIFAELFYKSLLGSNAPIGRAVQNARRTLFDRRTEWKEFGTVWAAYQHYGDPTRVLSTED